MIQLATKGLFGNSINIATIGRFYTKPIIFEEEFWQEIIFVNSPIQVSLPFDSFLGIEQDVDSNIASFLDIKSIINVSFDGFSEINLHEEDNSLISNITKQVSRVAISVDAESFISTKPDADPDTELDNETVIKFDSFIVTQTQFDSEILIAIENKNSFIVTKVSEESKVFEQNEDSSKITEVIEKNSIVGAIRNIPSFTTTILEIPSPLQNLEE